MSYFKFCFIKGVEEIPQIFLHWKQTRVFWFLYIFPQRSWTLKRFKSTIAKRKHSLLNAFKFNAQDFYLRHTRNCQAHKMKGNNSYICPSNSSVCVSKWTSHTCLFYIETNILVSDYLLSMTILSTTPLLWIHIFLPFII